MTFDLVKFMSSPHCGDRVKQLPDGWVTGLLKTDSPNDPPYVADIFA